MLELQDFSCGYGGTAAVESLNCTFAAGALTALLGPNGAGKTSTLMAVMGHVAPMGGRILFEGRDITNRPPVDRSKIGIAVVPEGRQLFGDLTVEENLIVGGYSLPVAAARAEQEQVYSLFPRLAERRAQISGSLSGGEQQMLAIGRALMAKPKLLLIDELSLGLMPKMVDVCIEALTRVRQNGLTIVLVEQNTSRALSIADHVYVLASGRCVMHGSSAEVKDNTEIFEAYVGIH